MATTKKDIRKLTLPVEGMTCASCVFHVEGALNGVAGVSSATVNLATEKAVVEIEDPEVPVERLAEAVSQAGYKIPQATIWRIFFKVESMNVWPPNPGLTDITNTRSTSPRMFSSVVAEVAGLRFTMSVWLGESME